MKKRFIIILVTISVSLVFITCNKTSGDPSACRTQTTDFQTCLKCCQDNGFSGASMPTDDSGNYTECNCVN